jgi:hypothetical protein
MEIATVSGTTPHVIVCHAEPLDLPPDWVGAVLAQDRLREGRTWQR